VAPRNLNGAEAKKQVGKRRWDFCCSAVSSFRGFFRVARWFVFKPKI
jgi:hypothetical protein